MLQTMQIYLSDSRLDVHLMALSDQQVKENKEILREIVMAVAKARVSFQRTYG